MTNRINPLSRSSPIALGTAGFGTDIPAAPSLELLDCYAEHGGNHIDTAHDYASWVPNGMGASERTIGQWLKVSGARERMLVATKGCCTKGGKKRVLREILREEIKLSLERLGLPQVDVYWLHRDDPDVPVGEILGWLEELRAEGVVVGYGASNWTWRRMADAQTYAAGHGLAGFIGNQSGWNLAALEANPFDSADAHFVDTSDEAWFSETHMPLVAFEAQAGGFFSGRYGPGRKPDSPRGNVVDLHYGNAANWKRIEVARELADKRGVSSNQVILAWLRHQAFPVIAVVGPRTREQLVDSLDSVRVSLSAAEVARLRRP